MYKSKNNKSYLNSKQSFVALLFFCATVFTLFGCTKETKLLENQNSIDKIEKESFSSQIQIEQLLHQDEQFHELVNLNGEMLSRISLTNRKKIAEEALLQSILSKSSDGSIDNQLLAEYCQALGYQNPTMFQSDLDRMTGLKHDLIQRYNVELMTQEELEIEAALYDPSYFGDIEQVNNPCETARRNCLVSVTAQAAIMQLGCSAFDITIVAGLICHAAAFAYASSEMDNCNLTANKCNGNSGGALGYGYQYYYNLYMNAYIGLVPQINLSL